MSGAGKLRRRDDTPGARPSAGEAATGLVRAEFQPTLPTLLRGRGRLAWTFPIAALVTVLIGFAVARAVGSADTPSMLIHRQPDFSLLFREGALGRVAPRAGEHVRLEGRGRRVTVAVSVAPLPHTTRGAAPALAALPIEADRLLDARRRRLDGLVVLEEGRARVNDAPGYQFRYLSGPVDAPRLGHDVLLKPEPPVTGPGLVVSLVQHNLGGELGPDDRRLAYEAKRAFRSVRFGIERP